MKTKATKNEANGTIDTVRLRAQLATMHLA